MVSTSHCCARALRRAVGRPRRTRQLRALRARRGAAGRGDLLQMDLEVVERRRDVVHVQDVRDAADAVPGALQEREHDCHVCARAVEDAPAAGAGAGARRAPPDVARVAELARGHRAEQKCLRRAPVGGCATARRAPVRRSGIGRGGSPEKCRRGRHFSSRRRGCAKGRCEGAVLRTLKVRRCEEAKGTSRKRFSSTCPAVRPRASAVGAPRGMRSAARGGPAREGAGSTSRGEKSTTQSGTSPSVAQPRSQHDSVAQPRSRHGTGGGGGRALRAGDPWETRQRFRT